MNTLSAIIIDDEAAARRDLAEVLAAIEGIKIIAQASDAVVAQHVISDEQPDLIFLDIHLPGINGFKLLENIESNQACVIFTTAYAQYAVQAFEVGAVDYLLKPVREDRCRRAIERVREIKAHRGGRAEARTIEIEQGNAKQRIPLGTVQFITSEGNYLKIFHHSGCGLMRQTLEKFLIMNAGSGFLRISRSQAVHPSAIRSYNGHSQRGLKLLTLNGQVLAVSRRRAAQVLATLRQ